MAVQTLNKYDFMSIYEYYSDLQVHLSEKTNGNIRLHTILVDASGERLKTAFMSNGKSQCFDDLLMALVAIKKDEMDNDNSNDERSEFITELKKIFNE